MYRSRVLYHNNEPTPFSSKNVLNKYNALFQTHAMGTLWERERERGGGEETPKNRDKIGFFLSCYQISRQGKYQ